MPRPRKASKVSKNKPRNGLVRHSPNAHLIAWGEHEVQKGVPIILVMLAHEAALSIADQSEILRLLTSGELRSIPVEVSPETWEQLYRRADRLFEFLGNSLDMTVPLSLQKSHEEDLESNTLGTSFRQTAVSYRACRRKSPEQQRQCLREFFQVNGETRTWPHVIQESVEFCEQIWHRHLENLRTSAPTQNFEHFPGATHEAQFFLRVWWPCWLLYGQSAQLLFGKAENGVLDALEKLIRLDKRILKIDAIQRWLTEWQESGRHDVMQMIAKAFGETDQLMISLRDIKLRTLVCLRQASHDLSSVPNVVIPHLGWNDLRSLFDAVAQDRGSIRDGDLPDSDEALRKAGIRLQKAQPYRETWDMFRVNSVP